MMTDRLSYLPLLFLSGCLTSGCTDSAKHQFGYTEPAIEAHHGFFSGTKVKVSSNFTGKVDLSRDAETGQIQTLHAEVTSNPIEVYDAQGRRITENFLKGRELEYGFKVEAAKVIVDGITSLAGTLVTLGAARNDPALTNAGMSLLDRIGPLLQGGGGAGGLDIAAILQQLMARPTVVNVETVPPPALPPGQGVLPDKDNDGVPDSADAEPDNSFIH